MRVLWLGNSDDIGKTPPPGTELSTTVAARIFEQNTGEPVEITGRVIWPRPELPDVVDRWVDRYEPDVVMFKVNGFWYLYPSVALRLQHLFGRRLGRPAARVGLKAAELSWLAHTRAFHRARRWARRVIGASYHFTPDEVLEVTERSVRAIVRHEHVGVVVWAPLGAWEGAPAGAEARVYHALATLCRELSLTFVAWNPADPDPSVPFFRSGDHVHRDAAGHRWYGTKEAEALQGAWR